MTPEQQEKYNKMRNALVDITNYQSPEELRENAWEDWGCDYEEALEMAYENIIETAKFAIRGVRKI